MKHILIILTLFVTASAAAQNQQQQLADRMKQLHTAMVNDYTKVVQFIDDSLSYGHSNGWVENAKAFREDLGTHLIYHSIKEDSVNVTVRDHTAYIRFVADIDVTMDGKRLQFHLKVLEVWTREKDWKLIARQAVK